MTVNKLPAVFFFSLSLLLQIRQSCQSRRGEKRKHKNLVLGNKGNCLVGHQCCCDHHTQSCELINSCQSFIGWSLQFVVLFDAAARLVRVGKRGHLPDVFMSTDVSKQMLTFPAVLYKACTWGRICAVSYCHLKSFFSLSLSLIQLLICSPQKLESVTSRLLFVFVFLFWGVCVFFF